MTQQTKTSEAGQATFWQRLFRGARRVHQLSDWSHFVGRDWVEQIMSVAVDDRFHAKQGRSTGRWILRSGERRLAVYLKRHYRLPWLHRLVALIRPEGRWSPALQEWDHLHWAAQEGMPVPRALAAGEFIGPGLRLQSFLAVEELAGMVPLHEALPAAAAQLEPQAFQRWKRGLIPELARLSRALHDRQRFHKDLYLCHFYIAEADTRSVPTWRGRVFLIDFHRLAHHSLASRWWQAKDLGQLLYSSDIAGVEARDRVRFWRAYFGPERGRRLIQLLRWVILVRGRSYERHNRKRQRAAARRRAA